jgi:hypothetical protein
MSTSGHGCHGHRRIEALRRVTAGLAAAVLTVAIASLSLGGARSHAGTQLALSSSSGFHHHPHVVELDFPASTTTIAPPAPGGPTPVAAPAPASVAAPAPTALVAETHVVAAAAPASPEQRGAEALQRIDYPWQHLGFSITFAGPNEGLLGKADCNTDRIFIYVRPSQTVQQLAFVTAFELGHAVDCNFMDDQTRGQWASIRGFQPGWKWFPGCVCTEDDYGSGDISMVFASWLVPDGGYRWRSNLAPRPSAEQMQQLLPYLQH